RGRAQRRLRHRLPRRGRRRAGLVASPSAPRRAGPAPAGRGVAGAQDNTRCSAIPAPLPSLTPTRDRAPMGTANSVTAIMQTAKAGFDPVFGDLRLLPEMQKNEAKGNLVRTTVRIITKTLDKSTYDRLAYE